MKQKFLYYLLTLFIVLGLGAVSFGVGVRKAEALTCNGVVCINSAGSCNDTNGGCPPPSANIAIALQDFSREKTLIEGTTVSAQSAFNALAAMRTQKVGQGHLKDLRLVLRYLGSLLTELSYDSDQELAMFFRDTPLFSPLIFGLLFFSVEKEQDNNNGEPVFKKKKTKKKKSAPSFL